MREVGPRELAKDAVKVTEVRGGAPAARQRPKRIFQVKDRRGALARTGRDLADLALPDPVEGRLQLEPRAQDIGIDVVGAKVHLALVHGEHSGQVLAPTEEVVLRERGRVVEKRVLLGLVVLVEAQAPYVAGYDKQIDHPGRRGLDRQDSHDA